MRVNSICAEEARRVFDYNPETGGLIWKVTLSKRAVAGSVAGCVKPDSGYRVVRVGGRLLRAHRVIWVWMTGENPAGDIDHINGIRDDNRWSNLREATRSQNLGNRSANKRGSSAHKGVSYDKARGKWDSRIGYGNGNKIWLGLFDTEDEAALAYNRAAYLLYGEYAKLNVGVGL